MSVSGRSGDGNRIQRVMIAGVRFIDENGGGPGIRLRKRQQKKGWVENGIIDWNGG